MKIETGINERNRKAVAERLSVLLADTYTLYVKTHNYHWNVTGSNFAGLHQVFETQYLALAEAADDIAERIRALGFRAPGSFTEFQKLSSIREADSSSLPTADEMIRELEEGHEHIAREARKAVRIAQEADDEATVDLMTTRMHAHEKFAWMLRSAIGTPEDVKFAVEGLTSVTGKAEGADTEKRMA